MKISRRFKVEEHEGSGELGFLPTWFKGRADPMQRVAHDMLEHFLVPQCNAAEAELMALGALLVIRIDGGFGFLSPEENLALVIEGAMSDWIDDQHDDPRPLASRRMHEHEWADGVIVHAVPKAFGMHRRNWFDNPWFDNELQPACVSWLRAGVRAAYRRYQRASTDLYTLGDYVFKKLDDYSQRLVDNVEEGDDVVITADIDACEFMATVRGRRV